MPGVGYPCLLFKKLYLIGVRVQPSKIMKADSIEVFFELVRAGLWADLESTNLWNYRFTEFVDWENVYQLAEEQSVVGVVLAGIERLKTDSPYLNVPEEILLQWIGEVQLLEQENLAMNRFIAELIEKMRRADIYTLLVKGQGVAQCYERPLWRASGDVDLLLSVTNYEKAKNLLIPLASEVESERLYSKHLGMTIDDKVVELHGRLTCGLTTGIDKQIVKVQDAIFYGGEVRSWQNGCTLVFLPSADNDVIFVFTHFLKHFYKEGLGLRQICDWCRLLWTYRESLNHGLLESRIKKMGLMSEWKAFGAFAVEYLGIPKEVMPLYSSDKRWKLKAEKICAFILKVGNMGHNRDMSYFEKYPYLVRKVCSLGRRSGNLIRHARIFPMDSLRFFPRIMFNGLRSAVRGE